MNSTDRRGPRAWPALTALALAAAGLALTTPVASADDRVQPVLVLTADGQVYAATHNGQPVLYIWLSRQDESGHHTPNLGFAENATRSGQLQPGTDRWSACVRRTRTIIDVRCTPYVRVSPAQG
jgi:hypothetical protein